MKKFSTLSYRGVKKRSTFYPTQDDSPYDMTRKLDVCTLLVVYGTVVLLFIFVWGNGCLFIVSRPGEQYQYDI